MGKFAATFEHAHASVILKRRESFIFPSKRLLDIRFEVLNTLLINIVCIGNGAMGRSGAF